MGKRGHHVLFEARNWTAHKPNKELREKPGLIIPIDWEAHEALHREVGTVATPSHRFGQAVLALYKDNPDNHFRSLDNLMFAVNEASRHPRIRPIEYQLGQLIIASVEAQVPFIREGILPQEDMLPSNVYRLKA
ncbi:hypothetical protein [Caudoviricetes sp.]|nr:hypothetical protein [Caudoviricetes sp.]